MKVCNRITTVPIFIPPNGIIVSMSAVTLEGKSKDIFDFLYPAHRYAMCEISGHSALSSVDAEPDVQ